MGTGSVFKVKWLPGHLLVVVAVLVCLRLGWWQWDRTREAEGTLQNFAYAILWPAFGASFIYMWWRFLSLEAGREAQEEREMDEDLALLSEQDAGSRDEAVAGSPAPAGVQQEVTEPDVIEPTEDADRANWFVGTVEEADEDSDPELAAYNRALAALAEEDRRRAG